jgi:hypothetical protein
MTRSPLVIPDRDSPQPRYCSVNIHSHDAYDDTFIKKDERMIAYFGIVRVIFDVRFSLAPILEKNSAANVMEGTPLLVAARRPQVVHSRVQRTSDHFSEVVY